MPTAELHLEDIKKALQKLREDIAKKEGEKESELKLLKKEYKGKDLDDLYKLLEKLNAKCDDLSRDRTKLMSEATELLDKFGY